MSNRAMGYVKPKATARNGEPLKSAEKLLLMYIADSYNDEQCAAWAGVTRMARDNGLSQRRVQEIVAELIRKREIWREPRYHDVTGRQMSNWYRFYEFDGEPPTEVQVKEEQYKIRGELASEKRKLREPMLDNPQDAPGFPQQGCGEGCDPSRGEDAEDRILPREIPQGEDAEDRILPPRDSAGGGCGRSQGEDAEDRTQNYHKNYQKELPQDPQVETPLNFPIEPPGESEKPNFANSENHEFANSENREFANLWSSILARLASDGEISEAEYLRAYIDTRQMGIAVDRGIVTLTIGIAAASQVQFYAEHYAQFESAARSVGLDPRNTRLLFTPMKAGRA